VPNPPVWLAKLILSNASPRHTAVLPKFPHSNCCKRVPNRPLRPHRGRFGTLLELLQWGILGRTAVGQTQHLQMLSTRLLQPIPINNSCYRSGRVAIASWSITAGPTLITLQRRPRRHDSRDDGLIRCGRVQRVGPPWGVGCLHKSAIDKRNCTVKQDIETQESLELARRPCYG